MSGINGFGNTQAISSPYSPFDSANKQQQQPQGGQQTGSSPYYSNDAYNVNNTSNAFDKAMASFTGKPVFEQPTQTDNNLRATASQQQSPSLPAGVSQEEVNWALDIEQKVKGGYKPSEQEIQIYTSIAEKLKNGAQPVQTAQAPAQQSSLPAGISQQEIQWALGLEEKIKGGYKPSEQETQAYNNLAEKLKNGTQPVQTAQSSTQQPSLPAGVSQQEVQWALGLEEKIKGGYKPSEQETQAYQALAQKLTAAPQESVRQSNKVTQDEVNWALQLEQKNKAGYTPNPQETAKYQDIANRLQSKGLSNSASQNNKDWQAWSKPFEVPRSLFETTPRIIEVPTSLRSAVPTLPTYTGVNQGASLTSSSGAPAKQEIDWALQLEQKVKNNYKPTQAEISQYKNISDRLKSFASTQPQGGHPAQQSDTSIGIGTRFKNAWDAFNKK